MHDKIPPSDMDSLSKRLKFLMDTAGIKQVHLASKLGVTPQAINYLCNSNTKSSKHTKKLAKLLNANEKWLASGNGGPFENTDLSTAKHDPAKAPIYFVEQLKKINKKDDLFKLNAVEFHWCSSFTEDCFGVYVSNNDLAPRFEKGDLVFLKANGPIKNGSMALIYSHEQKEVLFCYIYVSKDEKVKCGFVPQRDIGVFFLDRDDIIYGVFQESIKKA
ncbi:MAG: hypothetical protein K0Q57_311 [Gammaproteobacteria bacterium]|nr:hypothetical protein [Gammaproteobacteria bacterium]